MTRDPMSFDDPPLRSAVRRVWGRETAPPELRPRVERAVRAEREATAGMSSSSPSGGPGPDVIRVAPSVWRGGGPRWGLAAAAAAVVVIGTSIVAMQMGKSGAGRTGTGTVSPAGPVASAAAAPLPAELARQLLHRHAECGEIHAHDHHLFTAAAKDDFPAIAAGMRAELKHPVVAPPPMGEGWDFWGAAVCPVGQMSAAHLVYAKADALVSVFSLPASFCPSCADHADCDGTLDGHPMAGFVEGGAFYCVVATPGSASAMDAERVRALRDRLHTEVAAGHVGPDLSGLTRLASAGF